MSARAHRNCGGRSSRPLGRAGGALCVCALMVGVLMGPAVAGPEWPQFAGSRGRVASNDAGPGSIAAPTWVVSTDQSGNAIAFVGQSGPVASRDFVVAIGSITVASQKQFKLWAVDRRTGAIVWSRAIVAPALESWSSPAIDVRTGTAIVASGTGVAAFDLKTGTPRWQTTLSAPVVNASPLVTSGHGVGAQGGQWNGGLGLANRVFVTEYDGFGTDGLLTCINSDAFHAAANPSAPGEKLWSVPIGGSSGNTPAFYDGLVYVSTLGQSGFGAGQILAYRAAATSQPEPLWVYDNVIEEGFFGGVCVSPSSNLVGAKASVFAGSYAFFGGRQSSNLVKLDARTGALRWSAACNRTSATPVVLGDGRIVLSGGVAGFGSLPTIQVFRDLGSSALLLWDSAAATWTDSNGNGSIDNGEFLAMGGWSVQPVLSTALAASPKLFVGALSTSPTSTGACTDMYAIDVSKLPIALPGPAQPGYLAMHAAGCGSSPAVADENLYTFGAAGLMAFGPPPPRCDVNGDGVIDVEDLIAWTQGQGQRDVDGSGVVNDADRAVLEREVRRDEVLDMAGGRLP